MEKVSTTRKSFISSICLEKKICFLAIKGSHYLVLLCHFITKTIKLRPYKKETYN